MKLLDKIKDVLFDPIEETEQIKITPDMRSAAQVTSEEKAPINVQKVVIDDKQAPKVEKNIQTSNQTISERKMFSENSSPFLDFDEEEFKQEKAYNEMPKQKVQVQRRPNNVIEYEKRKRIERRTDYGRFEKTEVTEVTEKRKFRPSPIISPVYGILNSDYTISDIMKRNDENKIDVQTVRDKAFGEKKTLMEDSLYNIEDTVTLPNIEEKQKKVKAIDELLEDTSDMVIDTSKEEIYEQRVKEPKIQEEVDHSEDTLENDLFDLIDSMYDSKEDGE